MLVYSATVPGYGTACNGNYLALVPSRLHVLYLAVLLAEREQKAT